MTELLLVEDETTLRETLAYLLTRQGYSVRTASDGAVALTAIAEHQPDLILLDLMLPAVSGTQVCRQVRLTSDVPIIMLTAKNMEGDIVVGLELGADDYVTKPFSTPELLARIRAVLRHRSKTPTGAPAGPIPTGSAPEETLRASGIEMDVERHRLWVDGAEVTMPLREFELLELLLRNAGRVLTRDQLIDRVWGSDYYGDTKTLDVHVRRIRSRIEVDPAQPVRLVTVRGLGYRLED
ncbi:MAG: response regulator transcription factor [Propionibacteriaceae bacterium]|jgi:two-component system response regulator RegX3|nr:response regulator transcription factor [Propionibacteriaceae bacterium]